MNCCEGCGLYCNSNSGSCQTLTLDRSQLNFCSPTCISTYKQVGRQHPPMFHSRREIPPAPNLLSVSRVLCVQTSRKVAECPSCHKMAVASSTVMERDQKGKIQLYCSTACVEQSRPSKHALSGEALVCRSNKCLRSSQSVKLTLNSPLRSGVPLLPVQSAGSSSVPSGHGGRHHP